MKPIVPKRAVFSMIYMIRGQRVMMDRDLAELYGVSTGNLNQAVKRNSRRFPSDFMFQLTRNEMNNWISQIVISKPGLKKGIRKRPFAFTEHGVAMLSSVLNSPRAVEVNIAIIRTFVELRRMIADHEDLAKMVAEHEKCLKGLTGDVRKIINLIQPLVDGPTKKLNKIGFDTVYNKFTTS